MVSFSPLTRKRIIGKKINLGLIFKLALLLKTSKKETIAKINPTIFNKLRFSFTYNKAPIKTGITTDILLEMAVIATPAVCDEKANT
jgi:hypothetical protein